MSDLGMSFASLVKSNNGKFKTPKQATFLLGQCVGMTYMVSGSSGYAGFQLFYKCDKLGVVEVVKYTQAKGNILQWQRVVEGKTSIQDQKEFKRLMRMRKQVEKDLAERCVDSASYADCVDFDERRLANIDAALQELA